MIANFLRCLVGLALLPLCWSFSRTLFDSFVDGASGWCTVEGCSLIGGMVAFSLCWATISHPVRTYVLGHELTHAIWGLLFGAMPSGLHVSESGGSVKLTKSNFIITLAPYFFPFYTFVVILVALVTYAFVRPLPCMPLWMFMIGFTWAFHVLFTLETLTQRQPDVKLYGRIFSWTIIFIVNVALILVWLAAMTPITFARIGALLLKYSAASYLGAIGIAADMFRWVVTRF